MTKPPENVLVNLAVTVFLTFFFTAGRWFGGFDSLENALLRHELVQKEARTPKYNKINNHEFFYCLCVSKLQLEFINQNFLFT